MAKKSRSSGNDEFRALVARKKEQARQAPTEEDFARAHTYMEAQNRMFATIRDNVLRLFGCRMPLHEIFLFPGPTTDFEAYVFYETDADIETCGPILGLILLYEIDRIERFPEAGTFLSYSRLVRCAHESAGKDKGFLDGPPFWFRATPCRCRRPGR